MGNEIETPAKGISPANWEALFNPEEADLRQPVPSGLSPPVPAKDTYTTVVASSSGDAGGFSLLNPLESPIIRTPQQAGALKEVAKQLKRLRARTEKVQADAVHQLERILPQLHPRDLPETLDALLAFTESYHTGDRAIKVAIAAARKAVKDHYNRLSSEDKKIFSSKWAKSFLRRDREFFLVMTNDMESADLLKIIVPFFTQNWRSSDAANLLIRLIRRLEEGHQAQLVLDINRQLGRYRFAPKVREVLEVIPPHLRPAPFNPETIAASQLEALLDEIWAYRVFLSSGRFMRDIAPFQATEHQYREWEKGEYRKKILGPLVFLLQRAETEAEFRSALLLDALVLFPEDGQQSTPDEYRLLHLPWGNMDEKLTINWRTDFKISPLLHQLHAILGCDSSGIITALTPEETMAFFRLIRRCHQEWTIDLLVAFLGHCKTAGEIKNVIRFFDWYHALQPAERGLFLTGEFLKETGYAPQDQTKLTASELDVVVTRLGVTAEKIGAIVDPAAAIIDVDSLRSRLTQLPQDKAAPVLNQIGIPILLAALGPLRLQPEDYTRLKSIEALIRRMELKASNPEARRFLRYSDYDADYDADSLLVDLEVLTGTTTGYNEAYQYAIERENFSTNEDLERLGSQIANDLLTLPDPLDVIGFALVSGGKLHPKAEIRLVCISVLKTLAEKRGDPALDNFFPSLADWMRDRSRRVGTLAAEGALNLLEAAPADLTARKFREMKLNDLLTGLFRTRYAADRRRAFGLLDRAWKFLSPAERDGMARMALGVVDAPPPSRDKHGNVKESGIEIEALHFIFRHRAALLPDMTVELGRQTGILGKLLGTGIRRLIRQVTEVLPFFYQIADGENKRTYDEWAWHPHNNSFAAGLIVSFAYAAEGESWSVEKRLQAIEKVAAVPPTGEEGVLIADRLARMIQQTDDKDMKKLVSSAMRDGLKNSPETEAFESAVRIITLAAIYHPESVADLRFEDSFQLLEKDPLTRNMDRRGRLAFIQVAANVLRYVPWSKMETVWHGLGLHAIEFCDGGDGHSTLPSFMEGYLQMPRTDRQPLSAGNVAYVTQSSPLSDLLVAYGATGKPEVLGRSHVYALRDNRRSLVIKYVRDGFAGSNLVRELQWQEEVKKAGLRSDLPEPVKNKTGQVVLWNIDGREAIVFLAPETPRGYYRYLNDPTLSDEEFLSGISDAVHDVFLLARHGVFHTVPMAAFHNEEPGSINRPSGDRGKYVVAPDIVFNFRTRGGMGRFNNWPKALTHANFGASGIRDLEELATLDEIMTNGEKWMPELRNLLQKPNKEALYEALILGNTLLAATLLVGNRIVEAAKNYGGEIPFWRNEGLLSPYADQLLHIFETAFSVRNDISLNTACNILETRADWLRLARQMAFFMTPAHAEFVREGVNTADFPSLEIYGEGVVVGGRNRRQAMGPYRNRDGIQTFDPALGFIGPDGDPAKLSLGPVNGQMPIREFEKASFAVFLEPPVEKTGDETQVVDLEEEVEDDKLEEDSPPHSSATVPSSRARHGISRLSVHSPYARSTARLMLVK